MRLLVLQLRCVLDLGKPNGTPNDPHVLHLMPYRMEIPAGGIIEDIPGFFGRDHATFALLTIVLCERDIDELFTNFFHIRP